MCAIGMDMLMRVMMLVMMMMVVVVVMLVILVMGVLMLVTMTVARAVGMDMFMRMAMPILRDNRFLAGLQIDHSGFRIAAASAMSAHQTFSRVNALLINPALSIQQILGNCSPTSMSTIRLPPNTVFMITRPGSPSPAWPISAAFAPSGCARIAAPAASISSGGTATTILPSLAR